MTDEWQAGWDAAMRCVKVQELTGWLSGRWRDLSREVLNRCDDLLPSDLAEWWAEEWSPGMRLFGEPWERPLVDLAAQVLHEADAARCLATTRRGTRCRNVGATCPAHQIGDR